MSEKALALVNDKPLVHFEKGIEDFFHTTISELLIVFQYIRIAFLLLIFGAASTLAQAFNLTLDVTSCQNLTYDLTGSIEDIPSIPTSGRLTINEYVKEFSVNRTVLLAKEGDTSAFILNEIIIYGQDAPINRSSDLKVDLFSSENPETPFISANVTSTCADGQETAENTGVEVVESANATSVETIETATLTNIDTESVTATSILEEYMTTSTSIEEVPLTSSASGLEPQTTSGVDGSDDGDSGKEKSIVLEEGVTVGVLGAFLLAIVITAGCLFQRIKRKTSRRQEDLLTAPFANSGGSYEEIREADSRY